MGLEGRFAACPARSQHVEADPADDRRQPCAQVVDIARVGTAETDPRFLDGVVRLGQGAEHPICDAAQMGAVGLEAVGEPVLVVHGHVIDPRSRRHVTGSHCRTRTVSWRTSTKPSRSRLAAAARIASRSCTPRRSGRGSHTPVGAPVAAATSRPRSQRDVVGNGSAGRLRLERDDRIARCTHDLERTRAARGRTRRACGGREIHHGIEPTTGLLARDESIRSALETRRRRRNPEHARHGTPHVHVERRHRHAERGRRDGSSRVRADAW